MGSQELQEDTVDVYVTVETGGCSGVVLVGKRTAGANAEAWCNCACYTNWPAGGGQTGQVHTVETGQMLCRW